MSRDTILQLSIGGAGVTRNPPKASAVAMSKDALEFLSAAKVLIKQQSELPEILIGHFSPIYFLVCHSMELSLKAYLRAMAYDDGALKKLGHGLKRCSSEAQKLGLALSDDFQLAVNWLDGYHLDQAFRYHAERYMHVPLPGALLALVEPQIRRTCTEAQRVVRLYLRKTT